ncbi:carotenoid oxygenase family protein [Actinomadura miaoliensis]|uniref:Dioxygenase n=1 Tax=Actinomadura miaoliensis TaxID=430685 RepID=A0ABP7WN29_9ACTN
MATRIRGLDPRTALAVVPAGPSRQDGPLPLDGGLPAGLDGCFLQARTHPAAPGASGGVLRGPHVLSGVRLSAGEARLFRARPPVDRSRPLGPVPALAPSVWCGGPEPDGPGLVAFARPVREAGASRWHTVATYPGLGHAEHLVTGPDGTVLHARPFPFDGAPIGHAVALTRRHVVIVDSPVVHSRAAALVGARSPYVERPDRPVRVGLLPRSGPAQAEPSWLDVDLGAALDVVNAHDDGDQIVLDALMRTGRPRLRRWRIDPATGVVRAECAAPDVTAAVVDGRVGGRRHRYVFGVVNDEGDGAAVVRHDRVTGGLRTAPLGPGWRVGSPVFAPDARDGAAEGDGWLVTVAWHAGRDRCDLRVFDAREVERGPLAVVRLPVRLPIDRRVTWAEAPLG